MNFRWTSWNCRNREILLTFMINSQKPLTFQNAFVVCEYTYIVKVTNNN